MNGVVQGFDEAGRFLFVLGEAKESVSQIPLNTPTGFALHGDRLAIADSRGVLLLKLLPDMAWPRSPGSRRRE